MPDHNPAIADRQGHVKVDELAGQLAHAGFVAGREEAAELVARSGDDASLLAALVGRRLTGEPLAWITGTAEFCGLEVRVDPGVYVPRWHSEPIARRAVECLPERGKAIDLCCGSGAIAAVLMRDRPRARVIASDLDQRAVACCARNGVEVYAGDLFSPLPPGWENAVDVVVAVVPYVPTGALGLLQRDTLAFEPTSFYDGGDDGTDVLRRVISGSRRFIHPGGTLLLEIGGDQADLLGDALAGAGYSSPEVLIDEDGDVRGIEATIS